MGTLILRFARSARDAVHKKPQPLAALIPGDSHDRFRDCGDCGGGREEAAAPFLC